MKLARSKARPRAPRPFLRHKNGLLARLRRRLRTLLPRHAPRRRVIHLSRTNALVLHERGA